MAKKGTCYRKTFFCILRGKDFYVPSTKSWYTSPPVWLVKIPVSTCNAPMQDQTKNDYRWKNPILIQFIWARSWFFPFLELYPFIPIRHSTHSFVSYINSKGYQNMNITEISLVINSPITFDVTIKLGIINKICTKNINHISLGIQYVWINAVFIRWKVGHLFTLTLLL